MPRPFVLKQIVKNVSAALPDFNDHLLCKYRQEKIDGMVAYLDVHFSNTPLFRGELEYIGSHILSPEERIEFMLSKRAPETGAVQIRKNTVRLVRFDFRYENEIYNIFIEFPYVQNNAVYVDGTANYPLFVEVEKVIHHNRDKIIIQATGAPIYFLRTVEHMAKTLNGKVYTDFVLTTKLHWGASTASGKRRVERTPILLYHLCVYGLTGTLVKYGFSDTDFKLSSEVHLDPKMVTFNIGNDLYIAVNEHIMRDRKKSRVVLALLHIWSQHTHFTMKTLFEPENVYYKVTLGSYIDIQTNQVGLHSQAISHLESLQTMLDPAAKAALLSVNLPCETVFDLLFFAFEQLDEWLIHKPSNLYDKQLASLDHMLAIYIRLLMKSQYKALHSRSGVSSASIQKFVKSTPFRCVKTSGHAFRPTTDIYHSNWLITIGAKRARSLTPIDKMGSANRKSVTLPVDAICMDPSELVVESILSIPSSSPIVSGSINPFLKISEDGNILRPAIADEIENVYD